ncbi:hypothetical protein [Clostridioides difficile]|uniref:hypothetical protein n=1 Tax=Clostridioides difficile TaxID=1496 RepID=UPI001F19E28F|nr:hypothetical protein [Clostridioides difficile]
MTLVMEVQFGTDLQSYYDMFLKLIFKYNTLDFSRAYFDLTDWADNPKIYHIIYQMAHLET